LQDEKSAALVESVGKESPADHGDHADLCVVGYGLWEIIITGRKICGISGICGHYLPLITGITQICMWWGMALGN